LYIRKNPNTMLPRFYGVYSMKHEGIGGVVRFVVMNNWFATHNDLKEKYDLKGSTVGRTVGVEPEKVKSGSILKDLDIKRKIYLPDNIFEPFLDQLKRDAQFLAEHNVMDYSLLVGMSKDGSPPEMPTKRKPNMVDSSFQNIFQQYMHGTSSLNADNGDPETAYFGIIDVLQQYNTRKKLEHLLKSVRYEGDNISIVQPSYYAKRFVDFITSKFGRESEARAIIDQRAAEERKEKRRSAKDKEKSKRLKLSVPKDKEKSPASDDESSTEETRGKRSNTIY
jgi:1-phosphatidylinositol-4-phosphate 5-kinase